MNQINNFQKNKSLINQLHKYFQDKNEVIAAYMFGSCVNGIMHAESDLDIAALFTQQPDFQTVTEMQAKLSGITGHEVDLAVLNNASPIFARQALEKGVEIFCRNDKIKYHYIIKVINEYDDLKYFRTPIEKNILRGRIFAG